MLCWCTVHLFLELLLCMWGIAVDRPSVERLGGGGGYSSSANRTSALWVGALVGLVNRLPPFWGGLVRGLRPPNPPAIESKQVCNPNPFVNSD